MSAAESRTGITIGGARRLLAAALRDRQVDTPDLDARVLIAHALGLDHTGLIRDANRLLREEEMQAVDAVAARRLAYEPVARIVGCKEFWSLPLCVNAATLVPRPETETVVEAALAALDSGGGRQRPLRLLDIGTGSGALLLALLSELPQATGIATDVNAAALAVARENARRLRLVGRAQFVVCSFASAVRGPVDLVVCNPPYVAHDAIAKLMPGVRDYEPHAALDGGIDGLDAYRSLPAEIQRILRPAAALVVEIGAGQDKAVMEIFKACGLALAALRSDLNGIPRALTVSAPDREHRGRQKSSWITAQDRLGSRQGIDPNDIAPLRWPGAEAP